MSVQKDYYMYNVYKNVCSEGKETDYGKTDNR